MPPKTAEPASAQPLPRLPSAQGSGQPLPFHVAIADGSLKITAKIKNRGRCREPHPDTADNKAASAEYLRTKNRLPSAIHRMRPDPGDHVERGFEGSMTPHKETETGISFIIPKATKAELRQRGYIRGTDPRDEARRRASGTWFDQLMSRKVIHSLPGSLPAGVARAGRGVGRRSAGGVQGSGRAASSWLRVGLWILPVGVRGSCAASREQPGSEPCNNPTAAGENAMMEDGIGCRAGAQFYRGCDDLSLFA